jgi:hypothetical protein
MDHYIMGEGLDFTRPGSQPLGTRNLCVRGASEHELDADAVVSTFYGYDPVEIERTLRAKLALDGVVDGASFAIGESLDAYQIADMHDSEVFVVASTVTHVRELWSVNPDLRGTSTCDDFTVEGEDLNAFISVCGTHFLQSRLKGGRLVVLARTKVDQSGEKIPFDASAFVGIEGSESERESLTRSLMMIEEAYGSDYEVFVLSEGLPGTASVSELEVLPGGDFRTRGTVRVGDLLGSLERLVTPDIAEPATWGTLVVGYSASQYSVDVLDACGAGPAVFQSYSCLEEFQHHYNNQLRNASSLASAMDAIRQRIKLGEDVYSFPDEGEYADIQPLQELVETYDECINTIMPAIDGACESALNSGEPLCEVCCFEDDGTCEDPQPQCDPNELKRRADDILSVVLPNGGSAPPPCELYQCGRASQTTVRSGQSTVLTSRHTESTVFTDLVCSFGGVSGKLDSINTGTRHQLIGSNWVATASSPHTTSSEEMVGYYYCSPKSHFYKSNGTPADFKLFNEQELQLIDSATVGTAEIPAIMGLSGNFRGGGEWIKHSYLPIGQMESSTQQNQLTAWIRGYGVDHLPQPNLAQLGPNQNQTVRSRTTSAGNTTTNLVSARTAHCFLEEVGGQFDGTGEKVQLRIGYNPSSGDEVWKLVVVSGCKNERLLGSGCKERKDVFGTAVCMDYAQ